MDDDKHGRQTDEERLAAIAHIMERPRLPEWARAAIVNEAITVNPEMFLESDEGDA